MLPAGGVSAARRSPRTGRSDAPTAPVAREGFPDLVSSHVSLAGSRPTPLRRRDEARPDAALCSECAPLRSDGGLRIVEYAGVRDGAPNRRVLPAGRPAVVSASGDAEA